MPRPLLRYEALGLSSAGSPWRSHLLPNPRRTERGGPRAPQPKGGTDAVSPELRDGLRLDHARLERTGTGVENEYAHGPPAYSVSGSLSELRTSAGGARGAGRRGAAARGARRPGRRARGAGARGGARGRGRCGAAARGGAGGAGRAEGARRRVGRRRAAARGGRRGSASARFCAPYVSGRPVPAAWQPSPGSASGRSTLGPRFGSAAAAKAAVLRRLETPDAVRDGRTLHTS